MKILDSSTSKKRFSLAGLFLFASSVPALTNASSVNTSKESLGLTISNSTQILAPDQRTIGTQVTVVPPIPSQETLLSQQGSAPNTSQTNKVKVSADMQSSAGTTFIESKPASGAGALPQAAVPALTSEKSVTSEPQLIQGSLEASPITPQTNAGENAILVPNGAAIQPQLLSLDQSESSPWTSYVAGGFLILGLAATGILLIRVRQGRSFGMGKSERELQLINCLALSPKRQILLVRIRDKEVALASTEQGITLLTEIESSSRNLPPLIDDGNFEEPRKKKLQQRIVQEEPARMIADSTQTIGQETAIARSEMLMGALKNLREKNMRGKSPNLPPESDSSPTRSSQEPFRSDRQNIETLKDSSSKSEPTLRQARTAFPKYLANAFEQESKRNISTGTNSGATVADDAGSVTNMIRERLKDLRPLS